MKSPICSARAVSADTIVAVFDRCFHASMNTRLRGGAAEPLYRPAAGNIPAQVWFRDDYAASALHEVAHWCIAGAQRRLCTDYGYWYAADGRSADDQRRFMQVEARPQALEWCFSQAAGLPFRLSLDNLDAPPEPEERLRFAEAVCTAGEKLRSQGLPPRAQQFFATLAATAGSGLSVSDLRFSSGDLT